ncbi:hypothetical protein BBD39_06840 [Arsenophonus endosymbiont of Bemisia tabaci Asia II 3]|nr:hypothetical protein BBD39_06840 [Arsenophonus endosymbiont of Bemisia tabaci Asia II 3]
MEESIWENRYRAAFSDKLIKYKDFASEQMAATNFRLNFNQSTINLIEGIQVLTSPGWSLNELVTKTNIDPIISYKINKNLFLNIIHVIDINGVTYKNNWDYISDVLYRSHKRDNQHKELLIRGLLTIAQNLNTKNIIDS